MIDSILDNIQMRISVAFHGVIDFVTNPLWVWYFWGAVAFVVAVVIGYFLPFKWIRAGLGFALLLIGAFIAGGYKMHGEMADELVKARTKPKPPNHPPTNTSIFSQWGS